MALRIYDPDQCVIELAGVRLTGWADGEYATVEMKSDGFQSVVGTDGDVSRSKNMDQRASVVIKLMQTSPINAILSALYNLDVNSPNGAGVGSFAITDNSTPKSAGLPLVFGAEAWIVKPPDMSRDRTAKAVEWNIEIAECVRFEGGA